MRKLTRTCVALLIVAAALFSLLAAMMKTDAVSQWAIRHAAERYLPGDVAVEELAGDLFSGVTIGKLHLVNDDHQLDMSDIRLDSSPMTLFSGRYRVDALSIGSVSWSIPESADAVDRLLADMNFGAPFPVGLSIERARIATVNLSYGDKRLVVDDVDLEAGVVDQALSVTLRGRINGVYRANLSATAQLAPQLSYAGRFRWRAPLTPAVAFSGGCEFQGDRDRMAVKIHALQPFSIETAGTLTWASRTLLLAGSAETSAEGMDQPVPTDFASATENGLVVQIARLHARMLDGQAVLDGWVAIGDHPTAKMTIHASGIDPGVRFRDWPGRVSIEVLVDGSMPEGRPQIVIPEFSVLGEMLGEPVALSGKLSATAARLASADIRLVSGENRLSLFTESGGAPDIGFEFVVADPYTLWPPFKGEFTGKGQIHDPYDTPRIGLQIEGKRIRYQSGSAGTVRVKADVQLAHPATGTATVAVQDMVLGETVYPRFTWTASTDASRQQVTGVVQSETSQLTFDLSGQSTGDEWHFDAQQLSLNTADGDRWELAHTVPIRLNRNEMEPFEACWVNDRSRRCIQGTWRFASGLKIQGDKQAPVFRFIATFVDKLIESRQKGHAGGIDDISGKAARKVGTAASVRPPRSEALQLPASRSG